MNLHTLKCIFFSAQNCAFGTTRDNLNCAITAGGIERLLFKATIFLLLKLKKHVTEILNNYINSFVQKVNVEWIKLYNQAQPLARLLFIH